MYKPLFTLFVSNEWIGILINNYYWIILCSHNYFHWLSSFLCHGIWFFTISFKIFSSFNVQRMDAFTSRCICVIWHGTVVNLIEIFFVSILFRVQYFSSKWSKTNERKLLEREREIKWKVKMFFKVGNAIVWWKLNSSCLWLNWVRS